MYAIVKTGGKQYRVERGQRLLVERLPTEEGKDVTLEPLLFRSEEVVFDKAALEDVQVTAKVLAHVRGEKLRVFKFKPKRGYKRRTGHRQDLTQLEVTGIARGKARTPAKAAAAKAPAGEAPEQQAAAPTAPAKARAPKPAAAKPAAAKPAAAKPAKPPAKPAAAKPAAKPAAAKRGEAKAAAGKPPAKPAAAKRREAKPAAAKPARKPAPKAEEEPKDGS
jgi:large subunit ribosomal protein L21